MPVITGATQVSKLPYHENVMNLAGSWLDFKVGDELRLAVVLPYKEGGSSKHLIDKQGSNSFYDMVHYAIDLSLIHISEPTRPY